MKILLIFLLGIQVSFAQNLDNQIVTEEREMLVAAERVSLISEQVQQFERELDEAHTSRNWAFAGMATGLVVSAVSLRTAIKVSGSADGAGSGLAYIINRGLLAVSGAGVVLPGAWLYFRQEDYSSLRERLSAIRERLISAREAYLRELGELCDLRRAAGQASAHCE